MNTSAPHPDRTDPDLLSRSRLGYDYLISRILSGQWQPGDEIRRREVAEELGISLAPVNEAITQLEVEGYVEVTPRRQTRVRVIRRDEVRGLLILREAIECQAARHYCGEPVVKARQTLLPLAEAVDASRPGTPENEQAEHIFHAALVELVGSPLLTEEFHKVMRRRLFYMINALVPWQSQPPLDSHKRLLKKLQTSDPDAAEHAMRGHLVRGRERILQS